MNALTAMTARAEAAEQDRDAHKRVRFEREAQFVIERDAARVETERLRDALEQVRTGSEWWTDLGEIHRLARWLSSYDRDNPLDMEGLIGMLGKPYNWDDEYQAMLAEQNGGM